MELEVNYIFGEPEQNLCRVCLSTESNVYYNVLDRGLQNDFHNITGIWISPDDELPQHICCVCRQLLRKAIAFRKKSISTQNILSLGCVTVDDRNTVTTPLICLAPTDTLLISIPPATTTDDIETVDLVNESIVKEENVHKTESTDKVCDSRTYVKAEANEHTFDDHDDFDMDVEVTSDVKIDSDKNVVKDVNVTKILKKTEPKAKPKARKIVKKYPDLKQSDLKMDAQSVKEYLLKTNTDNMFAKMLHTFIIGKYIDGTIESNVNAENDDLDLIGSESEDESTPLNELIKVGDDSAEITNMLTAQPHMDPKQLILYEFMKQKYIEKKKVSKQRRVRDLVNIQFKKDGRVMLSLKSLERLKKTCNMKVKILTLEEQIAEIKNRAKTDVYQNSRFQCAECFRGFQFERTYNYHMTGHNPAISGNAKCQVCNKCFVNRRKLMKHQGDHKYRFVCKVCDRVCKTQHVAKEHAQTHSGKKYKCEYCFRVFCKNATRVNHIRVKHGSRQCEVCYELLAPAGLAMHNVFRHKEVFKCEGCDKVFNDADALAVHSSHSIDGACSTSERPCTKCGENFSSESAWMSHVEEHRKDVKRNERVKYAPSRKSKSKNSECEEGRAHMPRSIMCEMCGDMFISQAAMRYHQRIHTGEKPYACTYCPKRFRLNTLLRMHINTHTGERPHQCQRCPKTFVSQSALYRHQLVHTQERRHRCCHCEKKFQTSSAVKLHIKTVHLKIPMPPRVRSRKKRAEE